MCAGAFLGATLSRYVVAPVFVLTAAVVATSMLIFRFGPAGPKTAAAEAN
jgi:CBS domain containing-hemolysin-like protein